MFWLDSRNLEWATPMLDYLSLLTSDRVILVLESVWVLRHDRVIEPFVYDCHKGFIFFCHKSLFNLDWVPFFHMALCKKLSKLPLFNQEMDRSCSAETAFYTFQDVERFDFHRIHVESICRVSSS